MKKIALTALILILTSCMATHTAVTKRNLEVKTKMSETIFLDPVSKENQIVYIKARNTSGKQNLDIDTPLKAALINKGYKVTSNPNEANFILQANVRQAGKLSNDDEKFYDMADAIIPGILGGMAGRSADSKSGAVIGAVAGATLGMVGSAFVEDATYSIITDLQISQRKGVSPVESNDSDAEYIDEGGWRKYTTRVISYANKVNLSYEKAEPILVEELIKSVAGTL